MPPEATADTVAPPVTPAPPAATGTLTIDPAAPGPVPYETFRAANETAKAAKADAEAARAEAATAAAERAAWGTERDTLTATHASTARLLALARVGIVDDEHAGALATAYAAIPEADRPKSEAELWAAIKAGTRAAPRLLAGFLPSTPGVPADVPAPGLPRASGASEAAGMGVTLEQLSAARVAFAADPRNADKRKTMCDLQDRFNAESKARRT